MANPRKESDWITLRAAFGRNSAARVLALQMRIAREEPAAFRLIHNLTTGRAWDCDGLFDRSDSAYGTFKERLQEENLTDYFAHPPRQTPPRWLIPLPEGRALEF